MNSIFGHIIVTVMGRVVAGSWWWWWWWKWLGFIQRIQGFLLSLSLESAWWWWRWWCRSEALHDYWHSGQLCLFFKQFSSAYGILINRIQSLPIHTIIMRQLTNQCIELKLTEPPFLISNVLICFIFTKWLVIKEL